ncbi:PREDICTED: prostatic spermine-binding protein-like [Dinoponera quadriceps]|uniref:Prostatic spermine-binding protein-like n=1 Tax=Dinoponera quadriceps TaxID=609295 RepID=A0A6P3WTX1_DINQU|nr:PREDICTED: prostatic spermine-binding protein-like [Dinoponera quadriceps]
MDNVNIYLLDEDANRKEPKRDRIVISHDDDDDDDDGDDNPENNPENVESNDDDDDADDDDDDDGYILARINRDDDEDNEDRDNDEDVAENDISTVDNDGSTDCDDKDADDNARGNVEEQVFYDNINNNPAFSVPNDLYDDADEDVDDDDSYRVREFSSENEAFLVQVHPNGKISEKKYGEQRMGSYLSSLS